MSRRGSALLLLVTLASAPRVHAQDVEQSASELDQSQVVASVRAHNPNVQAALYGLESSKKDVLRLDAKYTPSVVLDGSASDISTPSLYPSGVSKNRTRRVDLGGELRKHLLWGTDLTLRVSGNVQESIFVRPAIGAAGAPTGAVGAGGFGGGFVPAGRYGPGLGWLAKLTLKQPLLRGRGEDVAQADLNAARATEGVAEQTGTRVVSETLRDALGAYWELWYANTALAIQIAARGVAERQVAEANARVATGSLAPVEVLAFETELSSREEDVAKAVAERKRSELELQRLLGEDAERPLTVSARPPEVAAALSQALLEERALAQSAEVRESQGTLQLAVVRARTASDPLRQRLDLDAYVQGQGLSNREHKPVYGEDMMTVIDTTTGDFQSLAAWGAFVGLTYEIPVSKQAEHAAAAKAQADVREAEAQLQGVRQRVIADVRKAIEQQHAQERSVALAERTREIATRQLAAEEARFKTGAGTTLQVIQAEDKRRAAELRVARAQADLAETALRLDHLTGQLLAKVAR
jgi:outer membrane protein TolC